MLLRAAAARAEPQPGRVAVGIVKGVLLVAVKEKGRERERERKGREGLREEVQRRVGPEGLLLISFCISQKHFTVYRLFDFFVWRLGFC